eukprot:1139976-Rhodomonas_salina.1
MCIRDRSGTACVRVWYSVCTALTRARAHQHTGTHTVPGTHTVWYSVCRTMCAHLVQRVHNTDPCACTPVSGESAADAPLLPRLHARPGPFPLNLACIRAALLYASPAFPLNFAGFRAVLHNSSGILARFLTSCTPSRQTSPAFGLSGLT